MIIRLLFLIFIFITSHAFAQPEQTSRYEIKVKRSDEPFSIIPADTLGLFLVQETNDYEKRNKLWNLIFLDQDLSKKREEQLSIDSKNQWIGYEYNAPHLYLLFRQGDYKTSDLHVIRIDATDGAINRYDIKNEIDFNITHFSVCKNSALMGGYVDNRPTLLLYNFDNEQIKAVPGFYLQDAQLIDMTVNVNNTFNVLISNKKNLPNKSLQLKVYDANGDVLAEDIFTIPEGKDIFTGVTSKLENENLVVTGTFGSTNSKLAEGLFWGRADLTKEQELTLIPLADFSSLYDYVSSEKRREKLRRKAEKKKETNLFFKKEHIYMHKVLEEDGKYYLLVEFFDPVKYRSSHIATPYAINQRYGTFPYPYSRFYSRLPYAYDVDEYANIEYQQAMVAAIDGAGNLLWDKALVFDEKERATLEQISDITIKDSEVAIAYKQEDQLHWKSINSADTTYSDSIVNIMMTKPSDYLQNESDNEGGIKYWYDGAFYLWGYQTLKRSGEEQSYERDYVFYVNKFEIN